MNKQCKFLIIDDDPVNNMLCDYVIAEAMPKAEVFSVTKPEEGLKVIKEKLSSEKLLKPPVNILLDINMPSMSGWDVLDALSNMEPEERKQFVVFMLSSSKDQRDVNKASDHPLVADYFSKPLTKEKLDRIQRCNPCNCH